MKWSPPVPSKMMDAGAPRTTNAHRQNANQCGSGGGGEKPRNCDNPVCGQAATRRAYTFYFDKSTVITVALRK